VTGMKMLVRSASIVVILAGAVAAQTETFDIATFVAPRGWSRAESGGVLTLMDRRARLGRVEFCQIHLTPSRPSQASPMENFQIDWQNRIAAPFMITGRPAPKAETTPEGWTAVTGYTDVAGQGSPMRVILLTATGFGKAVSVIVMVSPNSFHEELQAFFQRLRFQTTGGGLGGPLSQSPPPGGFTQRESANAPAASGSLAAYDYAVPNGWARQQAADRIVLTSQPYPNGEQCQVTMLPLRPAGQQIADYAVGTFRQLFQADPLSTYPSPPPRLEHGIASGGWEYFRIRKLVGGQEGEARTRGAMVLVAKSGDQYATIVATSKDFLVSKCFGEMAYDTWPRIFYSLQFKNAQLQEQDEAAMRQHLAGTWMMATGSVGLHYTFLPNGRFDSTGATQYRTLLNNSEMLTTTTAYFGEGSYAIHGNQMALTRDSDHRQTTLYFRVQQESRDSGRTWYDELCTLDPSMTGEVCYRKQPN